MIDWKEAARSYRARYRAAMRTIDHRTSLAAAEHTKRVTLVNAMSELLPRLSVYGPWCRACDLRISDGHRKGCNYLAALAAVAEAGRSVEL